MKKERLLINYIYCHPVGHVVEALKHAKGYKSANKNLDVYLLLNARSAWELVKGCPWIKKAYAVDPYEVRKKKENASSLKKVPKLWDYVITDNRAPKYSGPDDGWEILRCYEVTKDYFKARKGKGFTYTSKDPSAQILPCNPNSHIDIQIPAKALKFAERYRHSGLKITILPAGSGKPGRYPSIESWENIIKTFNKEFPDTKIYITGFNKISKKTRTRAYTLDQIKNLVNKFDNVVNCYNIGLWNQLALIKNSDILVSPHTGFSFLAQTVGTPWLAISGWWWPEYILNDVKFYSALPDCKLYPCNPGSPCDDKINAGKKADCMSDETIKKRISEIMKGAKLLMDKKFTYKKALSIHLKKVKPFLKSGKLGFLDGVKNL